MIMCAMVFLQVVLRYVFNEPLSWSDEIAQYMMLWSVYLSVSWAVRERAHIRVMNFINLFPRTISLWLTIFSDLVWFAMGVFCIFVATEITERFSVNNTIIDSRFGHIDLF